jgi:hypothetical protein
MIVLHLAWNIRIYVCAKSNYINFTKIVENKNNIYDIKLAS